MVQSVSAVAGKEEQEKYSIRLISHRVSTVEGERAKSGLHSLWKQRLCGVALVLAGLLCWLVEKNLTALLFLSVFYIPLLGKQHVLGDEEGI